MSFLLEEDGLDVAANLSVDVRPRAALGRCKQEVPVDESAEVFPKPADTASPCKKDNQAGTENILKNEYHLFCWTSPLNGLESEQTLGDSEGQRSLAGCCPWGHRIGRDLVTEQQTSGPSTVTCY